MGKKIVRTPEEEIIYREALAKRRREIALESVTKRELNKKNKMAGKNEGNTGAASSPQSNGHETPAPSTNGDDVIMGVPKQEDVSAFRVEPKIEEHVGGNQSSNGSTSPPKIEGQESVHQGPVNIGGETVNPDEQVPNFPNPPGANGSASGSTHETPPGTPMSDGPDGPGVNLNKEQAEITFNKAVEGYQNFASEITGWLKINPEKIEEYRTAEPSVKSNIDQGLNKYNAETLKALSLEEDDIALIKEPAIEVLQEEGLVKDNKTLLKYGLLYIGAKKASVLVKTVISRRKVKQEIIETISEGIAQMNGIKEMASDILKNAQKVSEEALKTQARADKTMADLELMKQYLREQYGDKFVVTHVEGNTLKKEEPVLATN